MDKIFDFEISASYYAVDQLPETSGVYMIMGKFSGNMVYGGQSNNIKVRFHQHMCENGQRAEMRDALKATDPTRIAIGVFNLSDCERASGLTGKHALRCVESLLIYRLRPHFNRHRFTRYDGGNFLRLVSDDHLSMSIGVCSNKSYIAFLDDLI